MTRGKLVVLGLAVACLLACHVVVAEEISPSVAPATGICPSAPATGTEGGIPVQPLDGAVLESPGLCPVVCPMTCPGTWTCNFGNCVCD